MKKMMIALGFLLVSSISYADTIYDVIGPSTATVNSQAVNLSSITIASPGSSYRNCLTDLDVTANYSITLSIRDGNAANTGIYFIDIATSATSGYPISTPFSRRWPEENPLCSSNNASMFIIVSTGTAKISYRGQIRGTR